MAFGDRSFLGLALAQQLFRRFAADLTCAHGSTPSINSLPLDRKVTGCRGQSEILFWKESRAPASRRRHPRWRNFRTLRLKVLAVVGRRYTGVLPRPRAHRN